MINSKSILFILLGLFGLYNQSYALDELTAKLGVEGIVNLVILTGGAYLIQKYFLQRKITLKNNIKIMNIKEYEFKEKCIIFKELNEYIQKNINDDKFIDKYSDISYVKINACLDLIDDACTGILGFQIYENNINKNYLNIIGILQCFYIIQDSLKVIGKLLNMKTINIYTTVRNIRNSIIGHPTNYEKIKNSKIYNSYIIDRYTINESGLEYRIRDEKGDTIYLDKNNSKLNINFELVFGNEFNNLQKNLEEIENVLKTIFIT